MLAAKSAYQNQHSFNSAKNCLATQVLFKKNIKNHTHATVSKSKDSKKYGALKHDSKWQSLTASRI